MDKDALLQKTMEIMEPLQTARMINYLRHLTVQKAASNPWFVGIFLVVAFYAIVKRSKFVLNALFTAFALMALLHYTMPAEGEGVTLSTTLPFAFGGLAIGAVLIYLNFIKTE